MKGIVGDLGEMKIPLKLDAKEVKQIPYQLNPRYKEKVKVDLNMKLDVGIIEPVEESKWISPMVVKFIDIIDYNICFLFGLSSRIDHSFL